MNKLLLFCLILISITSCQKKKFAWQAGISAPKFYPAAAPQVSFYYQGGTLAGASVGAVKKSRKHYISNNNELRDLGIIK